MTMIERYREINKAIWDKYEDKINSLDIDIPLIELIYYTIIPEYREKLNEFNKEYFNGTIPLDEFIIDCNDVRRLNFTILIEGNLFKRGIEWYLNDKYQSISNIINEKSLTEIFKEIYIDAGCEVAFRIVVHKFFNDEINVEYKEDSINIDGRNVYHQIMSINGEFCSFNVSEVLNQLEKLYELINIKHKIDNINDNN